VEAVIERQIVPAVRLRDRMVDFDVDRAEFTDVGGPFFRIVHPVVGLREPFVPAEHQRTAIRVQPVPDLTHSHSRGGSRERFEGIGRPILKIRSQRS
jgi:hypothetical protein